MKKILILDDDENLLEVTEAILSDQGFQTESLTEGKYLREHISSFQPDLLVMDVNLPGKNGDVLAKEIRQSQTTSHMPIILISSSQDVGKLAKKASIKVYFEKPFDFDELISTIKGMVKEKD